jgi:TonB family protein
MKIIPKLFILLITLLCACSTSQAPSKEVINERPKDLVISGDSAYFPGYQANIKFWSDSISTMMKTLNLNRDPLQSQVEFVPVDKPLQVITFAEPNMPEGAKQNNTEGSSIVKIWVDEKGIPQLSLIKESSNKIFNEQSLISAMNCRFAPAIMNKGPIGAWVTIPYRFKQSPNSK